MSTGNRRRRTAERFALSLVIAISAGCGRQTVRRVDPSMLPPRDPARIGSVPVPPDDPAPSAPIADPPPAPAASRVEAAPAPAPTPTLDAGLMRAEALKQSIVEEVIKPAPVPTPPASHPAFAQAEPLAMPDVKASPPDMAAQLSGANGDRGSDRDPESRDDASPAADPGIGRAGLIDGPLPLDAGGKPAAPPIADPEGGPKPVGEAQDVGDQASAPPRTPATAGAVPREIPPGEAETAESGPGGTSGHAPTARPVAVEEPFEIVELTPCRRVLGFGSVEPWGAPHVRPGQSMILYCEVSGLRYEPVGERFRSRLAATIELTPEGGDRPAWSESPGPAEDECRRPRRDYFVSYRITLPATLPPGPYRLRLAQDDLIAGRSTSRTIPLAIGR